MAFTIDFTGDIARELTELRANNTKQANRIDDLVNQLKGLDEKIKALEDAEYNNDQAFAFDFSALHVFSIERLNGQTCIGYQIETDTHEWYLTTSMPTHLRLVAEFNAHISTGENNGT